jgi:hypothetical protein
MRRPVATLTCALVVLLAACGSSGGRDATATTSSTSRSLLSAADRRVGRAALIVLGDAPGYQKIQPGVSELADLTESARSIKACAPYLAGKAARTGTGRALGLQRGATTIDSSLAVFADAAAAQQELDLFRAPAMSACLAKVYAGDHLDASVTPLPADGLGDDHVAYRISPGATPSPRKVLDVSLVRVGRVILSVDVSGPPADTATAVSTVVPKVVDRMRAAGA